MPWNLTNTYSGEATFSFGFGNSDYCWPVTGDWDGNGQTSIGAACQDGRQDGREIAWGLMNANIGGTPQIRGRFGNTDSCLPVTGDWDGDGQTSIGVACKDGDRIAWRLTNVYSGEPADSFRFGNADYCLPVTGDWDGDDKTSIGVACQEPDLLQDGYVMEWYLMNALSEGPPQITARFDNGDYYQPTSGWGGPTWPRPLWPSWPGRPHT